jgi:hypothetical protein
MSTKPTTKHHISEFTTELQLVDFADHQDFRCSPRTLLLAYLRWHNIGTPLPLYPQEGVLLLISRQRTRACIITGDVVRLFQAHTTKHTATNSPALDALPVTSINFTCPRGFSWYMLGNYCRDIGIRLSGVKTLEQHFMLENLAPNSAYRS